MSLRVALTTLGCKVNAYDTAAIATALEQDGCFMVDLGEAPDVVVVNSCTVTDRADRESRQLARRARRLNPTARVVMTGCFAQVNPQAAALPEVDYVVGLNRLPDVVRAVRGELGSRVTVDDLRSARRVRTVGAETFVGQTRAFLKVQEGCNLFCTFCIVPFSRGASRSVPPREILQQLDRLAERGFREVVLTGVHLGGYGSDLEPKLDLADLVAMLLEHDRVPRLRLSSIDPPELSPRLLALFRQHPALCRHLHVPIQAAEDAVLGRMRRQYDVRLVEDRLAAVREALPDAAIGTDVIAGFPGETEEQHEAGRERLSRLPLTYFHVFPYSRRTGTTAAKLPGHLSRQVIRHRASQLRQLGEAHHHAFASRHVGRVLSVLTEQGDASPTGVSGYSRNYLRVHIEGTNLPTNEELPVRVERFENGRLVGRVESPSRDGGRLGLAG